MKNDNTTHDANMYSKNEVPYDIESDLTYVEKLYKLIYYNITMRIYDHFRQSE